jgi:hypothetical protein
MGTFAPASGGPQMVIMQGDGTVSRMIVGTESSTDIATGYDTTFRPNFSSANGRLYYTNDVDRVQVYGGVADALDAGIAGPGVAMGAPTESTGIVTAGVHLLRYRYVNSQAPIGDGYNYRSDPSNEIAYTVTGTAASLVFTVGTATTNNIIVPSTGQATAFRIEMTVAAGTTFYEAGDTQFGVSTVKVNLSDDLLAEQTTVLTATEDGHLQPPGCRCITTVGDRTFVGGEHEHALASVSVTSDSTTVTYAGMPTIWQSRNVRIGTDDKIYQIATVASTSFTLISAYTGATNTDVSAIVFPKDINRVHYSHSFLPESFPALNAFDTLVGTGDRMVGMTDHVSQLWICGRRTTERRYWVQGGDPGLGDSVIVSREMGVWNQRCLVQVDDDTVYGWGPNGVWTLQGGRPVWISRAVDPSWQELVSADINEEDAESFFGVYDAQRRNLVWFFRVAGATLLLRSLSLDISGSAKRWALDTRQLPLDCGVTAATAGGRAYAYVGSSDRTKIYRANQAWKLDGVNSATNGIYTVGTGSTTTDTVVLESLPSGGLLGATLYVPSTGESVAITANTADTITHAALASALTYGATVYAGSIPVEITTCWIVGGGPDTKQVMRYLLIEVAAASDAPTAIVRFYRNYSSTPVPLTNPDARALNKGITLGSDGTSFNVDLDSDENNGAVYVPTPSDWGRSFRASVTIYEPGATRILDLRFVPANGKQGAAR